MSSVLEGRVDRRAVFVLGALVLVTLVVVATRVFPAATPRAGVEVPSTTAGAGNVRAAESLSVDVAASPRRDLLEQDLKDAWRAQILLQSYVNAASGLEKDLKETWRAGMAVEDTADHTGLEKDLKDLWRAQTGSEGASAAHDTSGLERDLKEIWRAGGPPQ